MTQFSDAQSVPPHLGIIPDGNRRWAKAHGLPSLEGHRRGVQALKEISYAAFDAGVRYITFYGFSTENWNRTSAEVKYLMELFLRLATTDIAEIHAQNVRFRVIGSRDGLSPKLAHAFDAAEELTKDNQRGTFAVALNYGGEQELADAVAAIVASGVSAGDVTPQLVAAHLYQPDIPPVDLIIRTSGEQRTSGFMLYRSAYAELWFTTKHWPDFSVDDLTAAITEYARRHRRFGQ